MSQTAPCTSLRAHGAPLLCGPLSRRRKTSTCVSHGRVERSAGGTLRPMRRVRRSAGIPQSQPRRGCRQLLGERSHPRSKQRECRRLVLPVAESRRRLLSLRHRQRSRSYPPPARHRGCMNRDKLPPLRGRYAPSQRGTRRVSRGTTCPLRLLCEPRWSQPRRTLGRLC